MYGIHLINGGALKLGFLITIYLVHFNIFLYAYKINRMILNTMLSFYKALICSHVTLTVVGLFGIEPKVKTRQHTE